MNVTHPRESVRGEKGHTAILVIHGIGEQNPFETLDSFARGLVQNIGIPLDQLELDHCLKDRKSAGGTSWIESFVRIKFKEKEASFIDVHEFYWAYITEEKINIRDVYAWVKKTLDATVKFYKENLDLAKKLGEKLDAPPPILPLRIVQIMLFFPAVFQPMVDFVSKAIKSLVPFGSSILNWLRRIFLAKIREVLIAYIGDIAIYTTTDEKSRYYKIRQQILAESEALLEAILDDKEKGSDTYDRVIVAGHSLGSVIAYDTLNRMNIDANVRTAQSYLLEKIVGLVTFGSPLDKVAFFFREHVKKDEYLRAKILRQLHSFKARWARILDAQPLKDDQLRLNDSITYRFGMISWINFFSKRDPVSGRLDYYDVDENIESELPQFWGFAHIGYWRDEKFYRDIVERFF